MTTTAKSKGNKRRTTRKTTATQRARSHSGGRRLGLVVLKWGTIAGLAGGAVAAAIVASIFWVYGRDPNLPQIRSLGDYEPNQVTRIAARDGTVIGEIYTERRSYVPIDDIPEIVVQAFISAEDASFFEHEGLDYWGMLRALIINVRSGQTRQGASTITQQVVKTFLLTPERTFRRKIQEIILARRLERALSKEEILSLYLNQIYFGHGRYGVQEASRFYFGKELGELNAGEAALLAGLPQSPERISPKKPRNQERAKARQKYVLEQMAHHGYITVDEARRWINEPIRIIRDAFPDMGAAPEWIEVARQALIDRHGQDALASLGTRVVTTVDLEVQQAAVRALRAGLHQVDRRRGFGWPVRTVKPDKIDLAVAKLARKLPETGPTRGEHHLAVVREIHDDDSELVVDLGEWKASVILGTPGDERYNPEDPQTHRRKTPSQRFSIGDMLRVELPGADDSAPVPVHSKRRVELAKGPQGAVVVIDPHTRDVLALVGGYDNRIGDFNRAIQARRQPGSSFKPLVYAAAIDSGAYTAASIVNDAPEVYDLWKPENYEKGEFAGPVRLRHALARSINTVAIRVLHDVGVPRVIELAHDLGIRSELPDGLSLALGSGEVTLLELTNAFATFAARGKTAPPRFIEAVGEQPVPPEPGMEVLSPEVAHVVLDMMTSVVEEGTARRARVLDMPVAGKTGTSNDARDAWFLGMTPHYAVGVWIGFDDNRPIGRGESGGKTALPVFVELMKAIGKDERRSEFQAPAGVNQVLIDKASGLLAPEGADPESVYTEVFVAGTEPTETALAPDEEAAATFVLDEYENEYGSDYDLEADGDSAGDDSTGDDSAGDSTGDSE